MPDLWLLIVEGDVEPRLEGPFLNDGLRLDRARELRDKSEDDGLYRLDINYPSPRTVPDVIKPCVESFSGAELEMDEDH